jgi:DNA end-binding protein Ku
MIATAETIIERRSGAFELASVRDRYQNALHQLDEAKTKGLATAPRAIADPPNVINLTEALKPSLAGRRPEPKKSAVSKPTRAEAVPDLRSTGAAATRIGREKTDAAGGFIALYFVSQRRLTRQISALGPVRV